MKILRRRAVEAKTGLGHTEIYEQIGLGLFPKPVRPSQSGKVVGWIESEIDQWIADLITKRDQPPTRQHPQQRNGQACSVSRAARRGSRSRPGSCA